MIRPRSRSARPGLLAVGLVASVLLLGCSKSSHDTAASRPPSTTPTTAEPFLPTVTTVALPPGYCFKIQGVVNQGKVLVVVWNNPGSTVAELKTALDDLVAAIDPVLAAAPEPIKADAVGLSSTLHGYQAEAKPIRTRELLNLALVPKVKALFTDPNGVGRGLHRILTFVGTNCENVRAGG